MKKYIPPLLMGLLVAAAWGYFSDLRNDQVGWFIVRLVLVLIAIVAVWRILASKVTTDVRT
jgi:Flp pilus assembly protein TadB